MFLFQQSTFYAWQIVFIISLSNLTFGTPYFPGIGISVMHSTETNDAQPNWDENDQFDEFDTSYDAINKDISRILEVLQDQLQEKENTLERKAESQRKLRKLKNVRLYRSVVY